MVKVKKEVYDELNQVKKEFIEEMGDNFVLNLFNELDSMIEKLSSMGYMKAYQWAKDNKVGFAGGMIQEFEKEESIE